MTKIPVVEDLQQKIQAVGSKDHDYSLYLTASLHLNMDAWKRIFCGWGKRPSFIGKLPVGLREGYPTLKQLEKLMLYFPVRFVDGSSWKRPSQWIFLHYDAG